jgi:ABC-2 type transport system ATP-binding protein
LENPAEHLVKSIPRPDSVLSVSLEGDQLKIEMTDTQKDLPELVKSIVEAGGKIQGVTEEHHSLEEIYLSLIREKEQQ